MDTKEVKQLLKKQLDEVTLQINKLEAADQSEDPTRDIDNVTEDDYLESEEGFRSQSIIDKLTNEKKRVEHTLSKIDTDTYGQCDECGEPILLERLAALPASNLCMECQEKQDAQRNLRN